LAEREPSSTLADFVFTTPLRVRWAEVDMQAVVFNGHYLTYADVCATEYWRAMLGGIILVLVLLFPQGIAGYAQRLFQRGNPADGRAQG
jgi:ABC-type branched-subunit amino acid transport system permease subunit